MTEPAAARRKLQEIKRRRRRAALRRAAGLLLLAIAAAAGALLYVERPWETARPQAALPPDETRDPGAWSDERSSDPSGLAAAGAERLGEREPLPEVAAAPATLPSLDRSDAAVRQAVARLSKRADLASYLVGPDLIRRFVVAVDNVAEGRNPRRHLRELAPRGDFEVDSSEDRAWIEPTSYERFDTLVEVLTSLDTPGTARLYAQLRPLFQEAYRDLGYPDGDFDARLQEAIAELLAAPVVEGDVELVRRGGTTWAFADPALEDLSPPQKQLVRMGPTNQRRVQRKLRELSVQLGAAAEELPQESRYRPAHS